MEKTKKKRICITISEESLAELDLMKKDNYTKGRSEVVDTLIKEEMDRKLGQ
jgi:metal-responsive CopG/Arc/MetJ family transcriptional regulator